MGEQAIRELTTKFVEMYNRGDITAIAELYMEDATLLSPNMVLVRGRQAIQNFWKMAIAMGMHVNLETEEADCDSAIGYDRGIITLTQNSKEGAPITKKGKYVVVVKRHADSPWRIAVDIWNDDPVR